MGTTRERENCDEYLNIRIPSRLKAQLAEHYPTKKDRTHAIRRALQSLINEAIQHSEHGQLNRSVTVAQTPKPSPALVTEPPSAPIELGALPKQEEPTPVVRAAEPVPQAPAITPTTSPAMSQPDEMAPLPKFNLEYF